MNLDWSTVMAAVGVLLGGGGLVGWWRVRAETDQIRSQTKVSEREQLTAEQQSFRQAMAEQIAALRTQLNEVEKRNDTLEVESRDQGKQLSALQTKNEYQAQQIADQGKLIADLRTQNATQAQQIATLTEEKATYIQRLQVVTAQKDFLERENNDLRHNLQRMTAKLPRRSEDDS